MNQPIARPSHPDHDQPWAMQLVIRRVKSNPAAHLDVLAAAGSAVVQVLDDPRTTTPGHAWSGAVAHWRAGWIRKVARRAENKRWDDVQTLDGVTATAGSAAVRAFVPGPARELPAALKKLQVGGTEFPREPVAPCPDAVVTVEVTPHAVLSTGKTAAQVGHAAQLTYERLLQDSGAANPQASRVLAAWRAAGFTVRVVEPTVHDWDHTERPIRIMDAGLTEVSGATETARAFWTDPKPSTDR